MGTHRSIHSIEYSVTVTASDSTEFPVCRGVYVGVSGNVKVTYANGLTDTLPNLAAGVWHSMQIKVLWSTGTTATDLHVGY